jgi:uncharacterized membrane protein
MRTRSVRSVVYLGAGLGLIVAIFAAAEFLDPGLTSVCSFNGFFSCGKVAQSGLTTTLGIPDWAWGVAGFIVILAVAALAEKRPGDSRLAYLLLAVTTVGVALSFYLLYVELVQINALCVVCASAYLLGGVAWVGAIALVRRPSGDAGDDDQGTDRSDDDP